MGMGYSAAYADVVDAKDVKKLCPKEYKALMKAIEDEGTTLEEVAEEYDWGRNISSFNISDALQHLCQKFEDKTRLSLSLCHYNPDKGDIYDTIDEAFWSSEGVWERTPAGKKYADIIRRETYVIYG